MAAEVIKRREYYRDYLMKTIFADAENKDWLSKKESDYGAKIYYRL